jgi:hypothetical protein
MIVALLIFALCAHGSRIISGQVRGGDKVACHCSVSQKLIPLWRGCSHKRGLMLAVVSRDQRQGDFQYEYVADKLQLPSSVQLKNGHGLARDHNGYIYFTYESDSVQPDTRALIRFNPDGTGAELLGPDNALAQVRLDLLRECAFIITGSWAKSHLESPHTHTHTHTHAPTHARTHPHTHR